MSRNLEYKFFGLCNYEDSFQLMKSLIKKKYFKNEIWFLEHYPVFTLGTAAKEKHILNSKDIPVFQSDRGGEVTYHGPGQLVIYFILDIKQLKLGPKKLVTKLEHFIISLLKNYGIESNLIDGAPGVYVDEMKIASIGLRISNGKCYHGISINVEMDLKPFKDINPCGYIGLEVTQINRLVDGIKIQQVMKDAQILLKDLFDN